MSKTLSDASPCGQMEADSPTNKMSITQTTLTYCFISLFLHCTMYVFQILNFRKPTNPIGTSHIPRILAYLQNNPKQTWKSSNHKCSSLSATCLRAIYFQVRDKAASILSQGKLAEFKHSMSTWSLGRQRHQLADNIGTDLKKNKVEEREIHLAQGMDHKQILVNMTMNPKDSQVVVNFMTCSVNTNFIKNTIPYS